MECKIKIIFFIQNIFGVSAPWNKLPVKYAKTPPKNDKNISIQWCIAEVFNPVHPEEISYNPNQTHLKRPNKLLETAWKLQAGVLRPVGNTFSRTVSPQEQGWRPLMYSVISDFWSHLPVGWSNQTENVKVCSIQCMNKFKHAHKIIWNKWAAFILYHTQLIDSRKGWIYLGNRGCVCWRDCNKQLRRPRLINLIHNESRLYHSGSVDELRLFLHRGAPD